MQLAVRSNIDETFAELEGAFGDVRDIALPRALNTLAGQADVAIRRKIRDVYGISTADLAPYFDVIVADNRTLEAKIVAKGKGFPLRFFKPRQTKDGVIVTIKGKQVLFKHSFLAALGGDRNVFARGRYGPGGPEAARAHRGRRKAGLAAVGKLFRASGETMGRFSFGLGRFPIALLRSSSPPDALMNADVVAAGQDRVEAQAQSVIAREIRAAARGF